MYREVIKNETLNKRGNLENAITFIVYNKKVAFNIAIIPILLYVKENEYYSIRVDVF